LQIADCQFYRFISPRAAVIKLGIAVWDFLGSRLKVAGHIVIEPIDRYVRGRFRPA
jgi:hypothetical protein